MRKFAAIACLVLPLLAFGCDSYRAGSGVKLIVPAQVDLGKNDQIILKTNDMVEAGENGSIIETVISCEGASVEKVEAEIAGKAEDALLKLGGIKRVSTYCENGACNLKLEFRDNSENNAETVKETIKTAIEGVKIDDKTPEITKCEVSTNSSSASASANQQPVAIAEGALKNAISTSSWWNSAKNEDNAVVLRVSDAQAKIETDVRELADGDVQIYVAKINFTVSCTTPENVETTVNCSGEEVIGVSEQGSDAAMQKAAQKAAQYLLSSITPSSEDFQLILDSEAADMKDLEALAVSGKADEALQKLDNILAENPDRIDAKFNKAVFLDMTGDHAGALDIFDEVLKKADSKGKEFYIQARAECARHYIDRNGN